MYNVLMGPSWPIAVQPEFVCSLEWVLNVIEHVHSITQHGSAKIWIDYAGVEHDLPSSRCLGKPKLPFDRAFCLTYQEPKIVVETLRTVRFQVFWFCSTRFVRKKGLLW